MGTRPFVLGLLAAVLVAPGPQKTARDVRGATRAPGGWDLSQAFVQEHWRFSPRHCASLGFYIAARGSASGDAIFIQGATNLPPGSLVTAVLFGRFGAELSRTYVLTVSADGRFAGALQVSRGLPVAAARECWIEFDPYRPRQSSAILKIVGRDGLRLGENGCNPQLAGNSFHEFLLDDILVG